MPGEDKIFRYKLDFYYQSALIYLVTLILYGGIRGSFVEKRFEFVLDDPLMYVIMFFVVMSIVSVVINKLRDRRLVLSKGVILFENRFDKFRIEIGNIEWIHVGREKAVQTSGMFQAVVIKLKNRRRLVRVRVGRYERANELLAEMKQIASTIPGKKHRRWRRKTMTDR